MYVTCYTNHIRLHLEKYVKEFITLKDFYYHMLVEVSYTDGIILCKQNNLN